MAKAPPPSVALPQRDLGPTLDGLLDLAVRASGASGGAIYLVDDTSGDLLLARGHRLPTAADGHRLAAGESLTGLAYAEGRSVASRDVPIDVRARPRRPDWDAEPPVASYLGLPLRTGGLVLGVLELTSARRDAFNADVRGQIALLADAAGLLIEETRLTAAPPPAALGFESLSGDPLGVATLDERLHVVSANPTLCNFVDLPLEAVVGRSILAVLGALGRPRGRDALEAALRGGAGHLGGVHTRAADGTDRVLSVSLLPLEDPRRGLLVVAVDVSARARLEAELRSRHAEAAEARDRLRSVVEVVSHELRTPLTSVLGYAQLLEDRPEAPAEQRLRWAALVAEKARLMARLIGEITDLARLGSDRFEVHLEPTDVGALVSRVAADAAATMDPPRSVTVHVDSPVEPLPLDADRIEQVVVNLLTNAAKFSPEGAPIDVEVGRGPGVVRIAVLDRGRGVPDDERTKIFEPFQRGAGDSGVGGSGLGLAIARGIAESHGGAIRVEDRPGGGAAFVIELPYPLPEA